MSKELTKEQIDALEKQKEQLFKASREAIQPLNDFLSKNSKFVKGTMTMVNGDSLIVNMLFDFQRIENQLLRE